MIWKIFLTFCMYVGFFWCIDKFMRLAKKAISSIIENQQKKTDTDIDEEDMNFFDGEAFLFDNDDSQHILMS